MKVTIDRGNAPKQFVPFILTIKVRTLAEANALYAFHGGLTGTVAQVISSGIISREVSAQAVKNAGCAIGTAVNNELKRQGVR